MDYMHNPRYQLVQIKGLEDWKKYGVKDATLILNDEFEEKYASVLDKSKKIILVGNWRRNASYFHFLSSRGYKVYLVKPRKKKAK